MPDNRPMPLTGEEQIPADPVLGQPLDNFPSRRLRALLLGWSFLIGVALLLNIGLWNVEAVWVGVVVVIGMAVLALIVGWWVLHQWNREFILYEHGFSYREGSANVPFLYAEIQTVRLRAEELSYFGGLLRRVVYQVTLTTRAGDTIVLDNAYNRVQILGDAITQRVNDVLRPVFQYEFEQGAWLPFADGLSISKTGVRVSAESLEDAEQDAVLPWEQFTGYRAAQRQLFFLTIDGRPWYGVPLAEVDNLTLLIELLRQQQHQLEGTSV